MKESRPQIPCGKNKCIPIIFLVGCTNYGKSRLITYHMLKVDHIHTTEELTAVIAVLAPLLTGLCNPAVVMFTLQHELSSASVTGFITHSQTY